MVCDLAEYYHIFDYQGFSAIYIATLVCGLPEGSRTLKALSNRKYSIEQLLMANMVDLLSLIWWSKTKDGQKNRNKPKLITETLHNEKEKEQITTFNSSDDFEKMKQKILEKKKNGKRN